MSVIPLGFHGEAVSALVVGGGPVGTRRAITLLEAGARVRVIAPAISHELETRRGSDSRLIVEEREYAGGGDILDATLVVAATASRSVNERVATDARLLGRSVNVADSPESGNFDFLATHRAGPLTVGVSAGGAPGAAMRIRDAIAERFDGRYAEAVAQCAELRASAFAASGATRWSEISADLIDDGFCRSIETGTFAEKAARWR